MTIIVNGENKDYNNDITLFEMMKALNVTEQVMAAAVNMNIVKQDKWDEHVLQEGDKVELLDFVGGG